MAEIRREQKRLEREAIEVKLMEGIASGPATEMTPQDWKDMKAALIRRHKRRVGRLGSPPHKVY